MMRPFRWVTTPPGAHAVWAVGLGAWGVIEFVSGTRWLAVAMFAVAVLSALMFWARRRQEWRRSRPPGRFWVVVTAVGAVAWAGVAVAEVVAGAWPDAAQAALLASLCAVGHVAERAERREASRAVP